MPDIIPSGKTIPFTRNYTSAAKDCTDERMCGKGNPYLIEGAIAVVTAAAQGLGLSITEQLARNGATVVMGPTYRLGR